MAIAWPAVTFCRLVSISKHAHKRTCTQIWESIGKTVRSVVKHIRIYSNLWVWLLLMTGVTCTLAATRAYAMVVNKYKDISDITLVIAKTAGKSFRPAEFDGSGILELVLDFVCQQFCPVFC